MTLPVAILYNNLYDVRETQICYQYTIQTWDLVAMLPGLKRGEV